jgi:signal transduction histidine kinase
MGSSRGAHVLEVECNAGGGKTFPARLRATKMFDDNLNAIVLVAIFEDLTAQKRMEEELRRNDRLRVLGQLSASVAHEIRNPLTGIANCAEVLASKLGDDPDRKKYTRAMLEEIRRLDGIIRNLLTFARPPRPHLSTCRVCDVVERVERLMGEEAGDRGVALDTRGVGRDLHCHADAGLLTQVLLNLVVNAIQACEDGGRVTIEAVSAPARSGARVARIDVMDDGRGVPEEVRESLFEPFVTTKTQGTGLGLAISHQIIEEHHGSLRCDFLEKGTRFSIELPQHDEAARQEAAGTATAGA